MRYVEKTFTVALSSDAYRANFERVFRGEEDRSPPPEEGESDSSFKIECNNPECACNRGARKNQP